MNNKKPDAMVLLSLLFGLGVLVSSLTYGYNEQVKGYDNQRAMGIISAVSTPVSSAVEK